MQDAIVIGGGPAGAHFAYQASKKGYSISLIESKSIGRYKCCAGGISKRFLKTYEIPPRLVERKITSFQLISPTGEKAEMDFEHPVGVTVYRTSFDNWLIERAIDAGSEVSFGVGAKKIHFLKDCTEIELSDGKILRSKLLVGAFGMAPAMFRELQIKMPEFLIGVQFERSMSQTQIDQLIGNRCEFYYDPVYSNRGYVWVFPKREGVSVGLVTGSLEKRKRDTIFNFIRNHPQASRELQTSGPRLFDGSDFHSAMIPNKPLNVTYGNRFLLLGDAAGLVDQTNWEGIFFAFRSADIAFEVFEKNYDKADFSLRGLSAYQRGWKEVFGEELSYGRKTQSRFYGENMRRVWTLFVSELNRDESLKALFKEQLSMGMPVVTAVKKIPLLTKFRLFSKSRM